MIARMFSILGIILWCGLRYTGPRRVRMMFQECGGAFVKIGQMLALRSDIVFDALAFELLHLLERLDPIPVKEIRRVIEQELGDSVENIFAWFDDYPLAVASFAQVHRAQLRDGYEVIIKVQKPSVARQVRQDLKILKLGALVIDSIVAPHPISARAIFREFSDWTLKELDYTQEAENIERFQKQNRIQWVKAPAVLRQYTTSRVLTEEYLEGITMGELVRQPVAVQHQATARHLIAAMVHQYFLMGYFHADPHPGNVIVHPNGGLQYVDFGMVGTTGKRHRMAMARFIYYALNRDYSTAIEAFLKLGFSKRIHKDLRYFMADAKFLTLIQKNLPIFETILAGRFRGIMERWLTAVDTPGASFSDKSAAKAFLSFLAIARQYRINLDQEITLFVKALVAIDAICLQLDPEFNLVATINEIFGREEYAWLFSEYLPDNGSASAVPFAEVRNREKVALLKEYYRDWFSEIVALHPKKFNLKST